MPKLKEYFQKNRKTMLVLAGIFLIGIFLRTYEFHDWLRFGHDQARDQWIISKALEGKDLPLLGPNAGTTAFQLGPIYYYFSYASEKIFGNRPEAMAYPSVFFSILSIPFLFFFLREFFSDKTSLSLTAIASVSYFLVINSRFSSNPNLITFFVLLFLFGLLKILDSPQKPNWIWSLMVGIGMGVGVQLHTTLLTTMPLVAAVVFIYVIFKNKPKAIWKSLLVVLAAVLILNTSQIYHEIESGGSNTKLFFKGLGSTSGNENNSYTNKIFLISACQMQANSHIISSFQDDIKCSAIFHSPTGNTKDKILYSFGMAAMVAFSLVGYFFLFKRFRSEKEAKKKNFLGLVILFNLVSFLIMVPIAKIIYVGYFINLFFIPFVLLGMIISELETNWKKTGKNIAILSVAFLVACGIARDSAKAQSYTKGLENNSENSTLSEVEKMSDFVLSNSKNSSKIYFTGEDDILGRFYYPIEYFAREQKKKIEKVGFNSLEKTNLKPDSILFYIEENGSQKTAAGQARGDYEIVSGKKFSQQTILILKR